MKRIKRIEVQHSFNPLKYEPSSLKRPCGRPALWSTKECAEWAGVSVRSMAGYILKRGGPPIVLANTKSAYYEAGKIKAWWEKQTDLLNKVTPVK